VELTYDDNGEIIDPTENTYDEKGNCVEKISAYTVDGKTVTLKRISTYDANGNVLTEASYEDGKLNYEQRYTYTADGKLARESYINSDGLEESYTENTYDEQGNLLSVKVDGMLSGSYETYENIYENGKLAEVKVYDQWEQEGKLTRLVRYDAQGNITLRVGYDNGEEWSRTEYTYENGKLLKVVDYDDGEERYVELYTYNAAGKLTERSRSVTDGESQRSVYRYDEAGNITGFKRYEGDEVKADYTLTYETVTVSEAVAEQLRALVGSLALD
jgi:YD repeat-containing protein